MILAIVLKTTIVLALAWIAAKLIQKRGKNSELIWLTALASALAIPIGAGALPAWQVALLPAEAQPKPVSLKTLEAPVAGVTDNVVIALPAATTKEVFEKPQIRAKSQVVATPLPEIASQPELTSFPILLWSYIVGVAAVAIRIGIGLLRLLKFKSNSEEIDLSDFIVDHFTDAESKGFVGKCDLRRSLTLSPSGPLTWGLLHPIILLPQSSITWSQERLRIVLLHELAHVQRRDGISALIAECACAVHWFNPLVWIAARELRHESERAADAAVVTGGIPAAIYAEELLQAAIDFKYQVRPKYAPGAQAMTSPKLESRLRAILAAEKTPASRTGRSLAMLGIFTAAVIPAIAAFQAVPQMTSDRNTSIQHAKALAMATIIYSKDYDGYFPNATSDTAAWNRVSPYLKSKLPVEAPKSKGNFHFNKKVARVSSSQIASPSKTPVWFEVLEDKSKPFAVAYADGHAKLVSPSDRVKFVKELSENFNDQQGLHIKLNPSEAKFLAERDDLIKHYKLIKRNPQSTDLNARIQVLKRYKELREMDEMKANTFDLQKKAQLQVLDAQKQLDKIQLKKQINDSVSASLLAQAKSMGQQSNGLSQVQSDQLKKSLDIAQMAMSKTIQETVAKSLEEARKANQATLSKDQLKSMQDQITAVRLQSSAELQKSLDELRAAKGQGLSPDQFQKIQAELRDAKLETREQVRKALDEARSAKSSGLTKEQLKSIQEEVAKAKLESATEVRKALEQALAELKKNEEEIRTLQEQLKAEQDKNTSKH